MNRPRVVIDTNVLLSGLIWNGNESRLLDMAISGDVCLLMPQLVLHEAQRVLVSKFPAHAHLLGETLLLLDHEVLGPPSAEAISSAHSILRDPNDAEILASIVEFRPDYAVTGDRDLLTPEVQAVYPTSTCVALLRRLAVTDEG